jgi:hypothetical protein
MESDIPKSAHRWGEKKENNRARIRASSRASKHESSNSFQCFDLEPKAFQ